MNQQPPWGPVGDPRLVSLSPAPSLGQQGGDGPSDGFPALQAGDGLWTVTGGGLAAVLDPTRGLRSLWRGEEGVSGRLRLQVDGRPLAPAERTHIGPGTWTRRISLPDGEGLVERGLLPDVGCGMLLHWSLEEARSAERLPLRAELDPPGGRPALRERLELSRGKAAALVLVPPGEDPETFLPLIRPLQARWLERRSRGVPVGSPPLMLREEGGEGPDRSRWVPLALRILDEAPLAIDVEGAPRPPFLAGVEGGHPRFLQATHLAETGLAAVLTSRFALAGAALRTLAEDPEAAPPLPSLLLAARWAHWSGRPERLLSMRESLHRLAVRALEAQARPSSPDRPGTGAGSAFPPAARILEALAEGVEPLGRDGWHGELRRHARMAREGHSPGRQILPVVGNPDPPPETRHGREDSALLPPPEAFAPPHHPAFASRRTLQAARFLRAWMEGVLGARADASYGRLRLAPTVAPHTTLLQVAGLRVGGAAVGFDCRVGEGACTFLLRQEGGSVPLNLVFEPTLPFRAVAEVLLGEDPAEVEIVEMGEAVSVRCQFPLDMERRITVVGSA